MKIILLLLGLFFLNARISTAQKQCEPPGDPNGNPGCPDGNCPTNPTGNSPTLSIPVPRAVDPNEIIGPAGYDSLKWVSGKQTLQYKILFENDPDFATAPAQNIRIELPIHAKLNPASFRVGDFGFRNLDFSVPPNTTVYTNRLDVRDSLGVYVDVTAGLDIANRKAFWIFQAIDPVTGLATTVDPLKGVLPVNDSLSHNGEGYVTFTIIPVSSAQTKDSITATARIIFDTEETIETNTWLNIIDAGIPNSIVNTVSAIDGNTAHIVWSGQDDINGVGIEYFDLYVSQDSGPFRLCQSRINANSYDFQGPSNSSYKFFTIATDLVGNKEPSKSSATNSIFLGVSPPTVAADKDSACVGQPIVLTATNCAGLVTWSNGQTGNTITVNVVSDSTFTANCTINEVASNESDSLKIVFGGAIPTGTLAGTQSIDAGQSANLTLTFTGNAPWGFVINGQAYTGVTDSPYNFSVSLLNTTTYTLTGISNVCGNFDVNANDTATVTVIPQALTTLAVTGSSFCPGDNLNVGFTATGVFTTGNIFTVQLSDSTGSFAAATTIGTLASTATSGTISAIIPLGSLGGTRYRIRVISSNPVVNGSNNGANLNIQNKATATLIGSQTTSAGQSATLTAILTGTGPWSIVVNGQTYSNITASPYNFTVNPTITTTYTLTSASNACGSVAITNNNTATVTISTVCNNPDLIVSDLAVTKYTPDRIEYTAQIKNIGPANADLGAFLLGVYTSSDTLLNSNDQWKYSISTGGGILPPNQTLYFSYWSSFNFTDSQYYLRLQADELGLINECNETNNNLFKLINKCTTAGNLNLTGTITSGYYATNQTVTIANAALSNDVLVVGRSIVGTPALIALNSVFLVGGCLNEPPSINVSQGNNSKTKPIIEFKETDSKQIIEYTSVEEITTVIYIWNATAKTKTATIQDKVKIGKGLNNINLTEYVLNSADTYILTIETPKGVFAKVIGQ